eukprot:101537_1
MAELMKSANYETIMIGKWHLGNAAYNMTPNGRGFNDYFGYYNGAEDYYTHYVAGGYDLVYNGKPQQQLNGTYNADSFFAHYFNYLSTNYNKSNSNNYNSKPLFTYLALQTIHAPIEKPPVININNKNMNEIYDKECSHISDTERMWYCQKIQYVDVYIGDLIELYKQLGLWDNTFLILTTDNGGMPRWNATGPLFNSSIASSVGSNYPLRGGKVTLFQGGMLGVAFISGPLIPQYLRGSKNNGLFHVMDWLPSILTYIGYNNLIPNNLDGKNIFDSLLNNSTFSRTQLIGYENFDIEQDITVDALMEANIIK